MCIGNIKSLPETVQKVAFKTLCQKFCYGWKGLLTRNVHVKYESTTSKGSKVMVKVKVFRWGENHGQGH